MKYSKQNFKALFFFTLRLLTSIKITLGNDCERTKNEPTTGLSQF